MKLYVDDIRRAPKDWNTARTNTEAIRLLSTGVVEEISLDHDICVYLRDRHIVATVEETYKPIAYYIAAMREDFVPLEIKIHSANHWGAKEMKLIMNKYEERVTLTPANQIYTSDVLKGDYD